MKKLIALLLAVVLLCGITGCAKNPSESGLVNNDMYQEFAVTLGAREDMPLEGVLALPKGVDKPPVVLIIHSGGQLDRDGTIGEADNKPYADLAKGLAELGVASLRYDKRYFTYEDRLNEVAGSVTIQDEVLDDAGSAIALLSGDDRIDTERIYLLGHQLGGMLLPQLSESHPQVKGIISMSASMQRVEDMIYSQGANRYYRQGMSDEEVEKALVSLYLQVQKVEQIVSPTQDPVFGQPASYWLSLNQIDNEGLAQRLSVPALILQGLADHKIDPNVDFEYWKILLTGHDDATFKSYDGLNHLLMPTTGQMDETDFDKPNHVDQAVIDDIAAWIKSLA